MSGVLRNLEHKIDKLLGYFPVVILLGVRQSGKTTLAKKIRPDWQYFDLQNNNDYDRIVSDFSFFFKNYPSNIIFDEAQETPELFSNLRGVIDKERELKNRFILTGSSSPELMRAVSESLAGRAAIVELGTLKMNEIHSKPFPDFYQIFNSIPNTDSIEFLQNLKPSVDYESVMNAFLKGGFPEPVLSGNDYFYENWMENYFKTYIERDILRLFPKMSSVRYRRFIQILSDISGTIINRSEIGRSLSVSENTIKEYLDIASGSFIFRQINTFEKSKSRSILKMPKGYLRDQGLVHFLTGIKNREQLLSNRHSGKNFECFVTEEIIKGLEALTITGWKYHYYRTKNLAEVDLILDGSFGVIPVEIKLGIETDKSRLASLKNFISSNGCKFGLVINNSDRVLMLSDKIIQIPAGLI